MAGFWVAALCATLFPLLLLMQLEPGPFPFKAWMLGVAVALLNGALAYATNRLSLGRESMTFMIRAALGHCARVALLAAILYVAIATQMPSVRAFVTTVFVGYFIFLLSEIAMLHSRLYKSRSLLSKRSNDGY